MDTIVICRLPDIRGYQFGLREVYGGGDEICFELASCSFD